MRPAPKGRFLAAIACRCSGARFTLGIDAHRGSGRRRHLHVVLAAAEVVGDIPVVGIRRAGYVRATPDVARGGVPSAVIATDVVAQGGTCYRASGRGDILAASSAHLVAEHAADDPAEDRAGNVRATLLLGDLLAVDPAALLGLTDDRANGSHLRLVGALAVSAAVVVDRHRGRRVAAILDAGIALHDSHRRDAVVQAHRGERGISARAQHHALAAEARVLADFPAIAQHDHRRRAVVESELLEVADLLLGRGGSALEAVVLVEGDLGNRLRRDGQTGRGQRTPEYRVHRCLLL